MSKRFFGLLLFAAVLLPADVFAQNDLGSQQLGRGYWHVFAAYAIVWILVFGWLVQIGRRLARVEEKLKSDGA